MFQVAYYQRTGDVLPNLLEIQMALVRRQASKQHRLQRIYEELVFAQHLSSHSTFHKQG